MDIEKLILDYLEGKLNENSRTELFNRINQDKEVKKIYYNWKLIWDTGEKLKDDANTNIKWNEIASELQPEFKKTDKIKRLNNILKYAAVFIIGIGLTLGLSNLYKKSISDTTVAFNEVYVPKGQKSQITLSDGTCIWLNSESRLTYPSHFMNKTRDVSLVGEAYFEVVKNEKIPFIVNTGKIKVKVLGTSFNIKSYPEDKTIETTLIEGKVTIQHTDETTGQKKYQLKPNQKAIYDKTNRSFVFEDLVVKNETSGNTNKCITDVSYTDPESVISWKEQVLIFDNESLKEISIKLERWYGYSIEIKDPELLEHRYKGKFENLESINQVLDVIGLTTPIKYSIQNRKIVIEKK